MRGSPDQTELNYFQLPMTCFNGTFGMPSHCCPTNSEWDNIPGGQCKTCAAGKFDGDSDPSTPCIPNVCKCNNGVGAVGLQCHHGGTVVCQRCNVGFTLNWHKTECIPTSFAVQLNNQYFEFKEVKLSTRFGSYSALMIAACAKYGMKPVCDHPRFCQWDDSTI